MRRFRMLILLLPIAAWTGPRDAGAQIIAPFGVGASVGLTNSVDQNFRLQNFEHGDGNVWVQYQVDDTMLLRGTFGSFRVDGHNAGQTVTTAAGSVALPAMRDRVDYALVSVSYLLHDAGWTSGLFGGVGGYRIRPDDVDPSYAAYADASERVWGFHVGIDADMPVWRRLSLVARITYHVPQSSGHKRNILTADAGLNYRF